MFRELWQLALADLLEFLPKLVSSLLLFLFFWIAGKGAARVILNLRRLRQVAPELALLLARTVQLSLFSFGAITALDTLGIHVTMLVAGLGLTGFAVGFALKDVISNALSGMLIIIFRPFKNGDRISVFSSIPFEGVGISQRLLNIVWPGKGCLGQGSAEGLSRYFAW